MGLRNDTVSVCLSQHRRGSSFDSPIAGNWAALASNAGSAMFTAKGRGWTLQTCASHDRFVRRLAAAFDAFFIERSRERSDYLFDTRHAAVGPASSYKKNSPLREDLFSFPHNWRRKDDNFVCSTVQCNTVEEFLVSVGHWNRSTQRTRQRVPDIRFTDWECMSVEPGSCPSLTDGSLVDDIRVKLLLLV